MITVACADPCRNQRRASASPFRVAAFITIICKDDEAETGFRFKWTSFEGTGSAKASSELHDRRRHGCHEDRKQTRLTSREC